MMDKYLSEAAQALGEWFGDLLKVCDESFFTSESPEHRAAAVLGTLMRSAKLLVEAAEERDAKLYQPLCLALAAACRKLGIAPSEENWQAALLNVRKLSTTLPRSQANHLGIELGSVASLFKAQMDEAFINAGVTSHNTLLDEENRRLSLGLAINWGMRFLMAYALDYQGETSAESPSRGLAWLSSLVRRAVGTASSSL